MPYLGHYNLILHERAGAVLGGGFTWIARVNNLTMEI